MEKLVKAFTAFPVNPSINTHLVAQQTKLQMTSSSLPPPSIVRRLIGRLRPKREIENQSKLIEVGDILPLQTDVEVLSLDTSNNDNTDNEDNTIMISSSPASIEEVINIHQNKKVLLFGMPGAFTPTCTKEHLPGILKNQNTFYNKLNFGKIIVVTTNDRFVNEEWGKQLGLFPSQLSLVSDADGDFIKSLGLMDDMGFGISTRSKRFAIVLKGKEMNDNVAPVVKNMFVDEGMDDCTTTSAQNIIQVLCPKKVENNHKKDEYNSQTIPLVAAATLSVGILVSPLFGGDSSFDNQVALPSNQGGAMTRVLKGKRVMSYDSNADSVRQILDEYKSGI